MNTRLLLHITASTNPNIAMAMTTKRLNIRKEWSRRSRTRSMETAKNTERTAKRRRKRTRIRTRRNTETVTPAAATATAIKNNSDPLLSSPSRQASMNLLFNVVYNLLVANN